MCEGKRVDEELSYSPSVLSLVLIMFLFPCLFRRLQHAVDFFVAGSHFSLRLRSLLSLFSSCKSSCRLHKYKRAFLVLSYALHLLCFRVVLASFTLTTMAVGNTSEGFASVLSPWSIWALNPFTATGYFDIPPPRWPTFLVTLFPILKEGMGLSLLDEFEVQYHVIKK